MHPDIRIENEGQRQVHSEGDNGHHGQRVADATSEDTLGATTTRSAESTGEATASGSLHEDDEDHRHCNDDEDDGECEVESTHGCSRRAAARAMSRKDSACSDAPPTSAPSTSSQAISSAALAGLTEPP